MIISNSSFVFLIFPNKDISKADVYPEFSNIDNLLIFDSGLTYSFNIVLTIKFRFRYSVSVFFLFKNSFLVLSRINIP